MIKIKKIKVEPTDVYDLSVPETECFFADNILVHNCEILLPTKSFKRLDPTRKTVRVKKDKVDEFMKNKSNDIVKIRKIS
jgi:hypothetical protein